MIVLGILLLIGGISLPLVFLVWLSIRMRRPPLPRPYQVGMWLACNFVLPVGLVLLGVSLISARVSASSVIRTATVIALAAAVLLLLGLAVDALLIHPVRRAGDGHDQ
jgi:hypothetical protein